MEDLPRLLTHKDEYTIDYPKAIEYAEQQGHVFWLAEEVDVSKDVHELRTKLTESELHGVITTLKLFTQYELSVGGDYWSGRVKRLFPRPDIERMANAFSFFELNVHAPFYNKINELLGLNTPEFLNSWKDDPDLKARMDWIEGVCGGKTDTVEDILVSLGAFSMIEGAVLYSSFAFLKHFQSGSKNKLKNLVAGINFSIRDENLHSEAGAWLFRTLLDEANFTKAQVKRLNKKLARVAKEIYSHEEIIIGKIFDKGTITGITDHQMKIFVKSRINVVLSQLGMESIYEVGEYNPISDWFYLGTTSTTLHDFFSSQGNSYNRNWKESSFIWEANDEQ